MEFMDFDPVNLPNGWEKEEVGEGVYYTGPPETYKEALKCVLE
jgi:hypothetical protein